MSEYRCTRHLLGRHQGDERGRDRERVAERLEGLRRCIDLVGAGFLAPYESATLLDEVLKLESYNIPTSCD